MRTAGIICEYNPFHAGHLLQLRETRRRLGGDPAIVCLMSGNYVQRGEPAVWPREKRAEAAVRSGADLVLELPLTIAVSAAGYFASGAVHCLNALGIVDALSFGSESGELDGLNRLAALQLREDYDGLLREALETGCSFASARQRALERMGGEAALLETPNNALAVEYLLALQREHSAIEPLTIPRDLSLPSASQLRAARELPAEYLPQRGLYEGLPRHTIAAGERAMLAVLRTRTDAEFQAMPFGSEGLWSRVMKACRTEAGVEEILTACKSKRYSHSRLRRMLLCLFLGLSEADLNREIPYLRVLAFNERGRALLHRANDSSALPLISGAVPKTPEARAYAALEQRASDLYELFSEGEFRSPAGQERARRPVYLQPDRTL